MRRDASLRFYLCASGENRTLTQSPERDFESRASTSSATEAF